MEKQLIQKYIDKRGRIKPKIKEITSLSYQEIYCLLHELDYENYYKNLVFLSFNRGHYLNFKEGFIIYDYKELLKYKNIILTKNNKIETNKMKNINFTIREVYEIYFGVGICFNCCKKTNYINSFRGYSIYCTSCSRSIGGKKSLVKAKITNERKYGVCHPMQNEEIKIKKVSNCDYIEINRKTFQTCVEKYGDHYARTEEFKIKREQTCLLKYGVLNPFLLVKEFNIKNGKWTPDYMLNDKELYNRMVFKFQQKFKKEINFLDNFDKRGAGSEEYHLDHKYSRHQGFMDCILPQYIGHICNLEMIPGSKNTSKGSKCSITKDELFEKVEYYYATYIGNNI